MFSALSTSAARPVGAGAATAAAGTTTGGGTYLVDVSNLNNIQVKSRLVFNPAEDEPNSAALQIASIGNGFYLQLQGGDPMQVLYEKGLEPLPTSEQSTRLMKQYKEQFYWPLAIGIALLLLELFLPDRKRSVARPATPAPAATHC